MTHLELENLVSEYLEGRLDLTRRLEFEAHVGACPGCGELVADVRRAMEYCHSAEGLEPAPWLIPKILRATIGERQEMLQAALNKLSPDMREAVILRDFQDLDYEEIAQVLGVPEGTVKSRINRGRLELARLLKRMDSMRP